MRMQYWVVLAALAGLPILAGCGDEDHHRDRDHDRGAVIGGPGDYRNGGPYDRGDYPDRDRDRDRGDQRY